MDDFRRAVLQANATTRHFRIVGPDETASNRLPHGFRVTDRAWMESVLPEPVQRTWDRINIIVAGKPPLCQWLSMEQAVMLCRSGIGIRGRTEHPAGGEPDVAMACAGAMPTLETLAAVSILREHLPVLHIRVVIVVDLMALQPKEVHPHGVTDAAFDALFTTARPVIFACHGYPWTIHRLTCRRRNPANIHMRGYNEEGSTTTPSDMTVLNGLDRHHLVPDVLARVSAAERAGSGLHHLTQAKLLAHHAHIRAHGEDMPEIRDWTGKPAAQ